LRSDPERTCVPDVQQAVGDGAIRPRYILE